MKETGIFAPKTQFFPFKRYINIDHRQGKAKVENCRFAVIVLPFRPKIREEKELRGENGAFDTETARFHGPREVRSA